MSGLQVLGLGGLICLIMVIIGWFRYQSVVHIEHKTSESGNHKSLQGIWRLSPAASSEEEFVDVNLRTADLSNNPAIDKDENPKVVVSSRKTGELT